MAKKEKAEEIDHEALAEMSGENQIKQIRYTVPSLKFNGSTDAWSFLTIDDQKQFHAEEIQAPIEVTFLKLRRVLQAYEKAQGGGIRTYTNEHNARGDSLTLFERKAGDQKARMIDRGNIDELKSKYPNLRLKQNLYVLYKEKVVKIGIRGKSLGGLYDYLKDSFGKGEHMHQYTTKLESHEETNEGGLVYYVIDFIRGELGDMKVIAEKMQEVHDNLTAQDTNFKNSAQTEEEKAKEIGDAITADAPQQAPQLDTIDEETGEVIPNPATTPAASVTPAKSQGTDDGEINVKEIPF
jgi:hypothetical protein